MAWQRATRNACRILNKIQVGGASALIEDTIYSSIVLGNECPSTHVHELRAESA